MPTAPGRLPGLGHLLPLMRNPVRFLTSLQPLGGLVRVDIPTPVHVVNSPDLLHRILVTDARSYEKGAAFDKARTILGNGVLFSEQPLHLGQRRLIQPAFHRSRQPHWRTVAADCAAEHLDRWQDGDTLDVLDEMHRIALEMIIRLFFAARPTPRTSERIHQCVNVLLGGIMIRFLSPGTLLERLPTPGNRRFERAIRDLNTIVADLARTARTTTANPMGDGDHQDLFTTLCPHAADLDCSLQQSCDEAISVLVAGTETIATTLSWLFHELARHPDHENELRADLAAADGDTTRTGLLDRLLNETLRLHTPNWVLMRRARTEVELDGRTLPAGTEFLFSLSALHRDPQVFPHPDRFDPDRWLPGNSPVQHRTHFIPFGDGNRKCLGDTFARTEMRAVAAAAVTRWTLRHTPGTKVGETRLFATLQPTGLRMTARTAPKPR
ncbi:pentalenene C13 hydroxylase [Streptomyces clavuligerus]|nr:pentalenene C13 hydroxylase [Streptomyces clavuligerus]